MLPLQEVERIERHAAAFHRWQREVFDDLQQEWQRSLPADSSAAEREQLAVQVVQRVMDGRRPPPRLADEQSEAPPPLDPSLATPPGCGCWPCELRRGLPAELSWRHLEAQAADLRSHLAVHVERANAALALALDAGGLGWAGAFPRRMPRLPPGGGALVLPACAHTEEPAPPSTHHSRSLVAPPACPAGYVRPVAFAPYILIGTLCTGSGHSSFCCCRRSSSL
jgi:hypothetical protein